MLGNCFFLLSQNIISGRVFDSANNIPLAFVNISVKNQATGAISDIDGKFIVETKDIPSELNFSFVGYDSKSFYIKNKSEKIVVYLNPKVENLNEVLIFPGENPAHRIINKTIENKKINAPENIEKYSYISYNKMIFTFFLDSLNTDDTLSEIKKDSSYFKAKSFLDKSHMLLLESITSKNFKKPDKLNEKILASRFSGLKEPTLIMLATQLQSFSFYPDLIKIADKNYVNPISKGSTDKYFFLIEDTIINESFDSTFVISFRPKKNKNFEALRGVIQINSNKYAIQNVKAEPNIMQDIHIRIQQKYKFYNDTLWFPEQLNTNIVFRTMKANVSNASTSLMAIGKTYINELNFTNDSSVKYSNSEIIIEKNAFNKESDLWKKYRADSLDTKELFTYHFVDSIGEAEKLDLKMKTFETLMSGFIPYKFLNFSIDKLFNYNLFEGWRLGLAVQTNEKLLQNFFIGANVAYGFKDKRVKYGSFLKFDLNKNYESNIILDYSFDVNEFGRYSTFDKAYSLLSDNIRYFGISNMDYKLKYKASYNHRLAKYFFLTTFYSESNIITNNNYKFQYYNLITGDFSVNEIGINVKFIFKEKFFQTPKIKYSLGSNYPIIMFSALKEISKYNYYKYELSIKHSLITKYYGTFHYKIEAGLLDGFSPLNLMFNSIGSNGKNYILSDNSFSTMLYDEFISDKYVAAFTTHNFGKLLMKTKLLSPEIAIANNFIIGKLSNINNHYNYPIKAPDKGYFETGIQINGIFKMQFIGYGVGFYYRYGHYSSSNYKENIVLKLSLKFIQ